ncbi:MAG: ABC transporter permease [Lachnospiraceae bacterium]|nr:ABC transporter permease [Lachnospiraceae bacterium]
MRISEIFRLVWLNLSQNKFKVIMTSIGIVVGSATIMMVLAIGTGGKKEVEEQFKNLNAGAIDISFEGNASSVGGRGNRGEGSGNGGGGSMNRTNGGMSMPSMPGGSMPDMSNSFNMGNMPDMGNFFGGRGFGNFGEEDRMNQEKILLTAEDMEDLEVFVPGISDGTISYSTNAAVEGGELDSATYYTIAGVCENYANLSNMTMAVGEFISAENNDAKEKMCVLGYSVAKEIFGSAEAAYDGFVYIDDRPYRVVGILDEMGTVASGISPDTAVFIPYETGVKYITGNDISPTITVIAEDIHQIETCITNIKTVLADSYPNTEFTISDAGSKMEAANASNETLQLLLVSMAVIVFIVGGIGIMNVLFVSVKERTNEIGILKALGCSRRDILLEFLLEAACISLVGACIGVLLSLGITPVVEALSVRVELSVSGAVLSLVFGVLTGSVFGFYPAYKASRLIPVVALNQE